MQPARRRTRAGLALALLTVLALTGCQSLRDDDADAGSGGDRDATASPEDPVSDDSPADPAPAPEAPDAAPVAADLTVVVDVTGEGATTTWTLMCEPVGGDHPDAAAACAALAAAGGADAMAPTPRDVACTEQWGGPQTARVTGTVAGAGVDATFDRHNGCEISRWDALEPLFGDTGAGL